jgi:ACS family D-galactonate transporter-like MFS transporter
MTPLVVGKLTDRFGWPAALMVTGITIGAVVGVWALISAPVVPLENKVRAGNRFSLALLRDKRLLLLTLSYAAVGYFQYLFFYWIQFYLEKVLALSKDDSRLYAGFPTFAMAIGMPVGGALSGSLQRRFGRDRGLAILAGGGMLLSAVVLLLGLALHDYRAVVACFTISLGVLGFSEGPFWTKVVELKPDQGGTAAAVMNTAGNGIGLLAPALTPFLASIVGWEWGMALGALVLLLGASCWLVLRGTPSAPASG